MRYQTPQDAPERLPEAVKALSRDIELAASSRWLAYTTIAPGDLTIKDGGYLRMIGATLDITDGNIKMHDGQIAGSALAGQLVAEHKRASVSNFSVPTSWGQRASIAVTPPSWAARSMVRASWVVHAKVPTPTTNNYAARARMSIAGDYSLAQTMSPTSHTGSDQWLTGYCHHSYTVSGNSGFTVAAEMDAPQFTVPADSSTAGLLTLVAVHMR